MDGWCSGRSPRMLIWVVGIAQEKATGSPPALARIFVTSFRIRVRPVVKAGSVPIETQLATEPRSSLLVVSAVSCPGNLAGITRPENCHRK